MFKKSQVFKSLTLREKCLYSEFFWLLFSRIRTEYGEILCISPCSVQMRENTDQKNSEYGNFLRSVDTVMIDLNNLDANIQNSAFSNIFLKLHQNSLYLNLIKVLIFTILKD